MMNRLRSLFSRQQRQAAPRRANDSDGVDEQTPDSNSVIYEKSAHALEEAPNGEDDNTPRATRSGGPPSERKSEYDAAPSNSEVDTNSGIHKAHAANDWHQDDLPLPEIAAAAVAITTTSTRPSKPTPSELEADAAQPGWRRIYDPASDDGFHYPEGGLRAWLVVLGAFVSMLAGFGLTNIIGTFQAYISQHQLRKYTESEISWILSIYVFILFFCGLQIGPMFDRYGPRWLLLTGCVCLVLSMELIGLCTEYWHFILVFSIIGGFGSSFIFTPSIAAVSHWFRKKRGAATGLAASGGSFGGVIFPLALQRLFPEVGFAWSTRILGFIFLVLTLVGNSLVRSRLPPKQGGSVLPDLRIFLDGTGAMALTTAGVWFLEWGLFIPVTYLTSYAIANGINLTLSYQLIAIFNAGSCFGRWLPGYVADRIGRFNAMILTLALCMVAALAFWLPAGPRIPLLVVFAVLFGFASGSNISLTPICVGQLCGTQQYGRYYATCFTIVSFGCLTGIPIGGALLRAANGEYWGVIVFTGLCYSVAIMCFSAVRIMKVGWSLRAIF